MALFEKYGAKLTIMADVAEIWKFKEHRDLTGRDDFYYEALSSQLKDAIKRGHDVQLHLHASYFNARLESGRWLQDWTEYDFASLPPTRLNQVVKLGKQFLEQLLTPVDLEYRCYAFRAANWSMSPSRNVVRALVDNGILIDTSVFKYGRRHGLVQFDYSNAHSHFAPWRANEEDICKSDDNGRLLEVPIYAENRWIGAFATPNRIARAALSRAHQIPHTGHDSIQSPTTKVGSKLLKLYRTVFGLHAWKADFNQCTGRQLVGALCRAAKLNISGINKGCFVLIGHSKLFSKANERSLSPFLEFVASKPTDFSFHGFRTGFPFGEVREQLSITN